VKPTIVSLVGTTAPRRGSPEWAEARAALRECQICRSRVRLVVDHCHETRIIRGGLCNNCNTGLGMFRENPGLLRNAATYLEHSGPNTREEMRQFDRRWRRGVVDAAQARLRLLRPPDLSAIGSS
jgi:hypothetical protein